MAAKPVSKVGVAASQSAVRKRLSRKSPGPELRKSLRSIPPPTNVTGPETTSVTWTSQVFRWLYSDLVIVNELIQSWINALNEHTKKPMEDVSETIRFNAIYFSLHIDTLNAIKWKLL